MGRLADLLKSGDATAAPAASGTLKARIAAGEAAALPAETKQGAAVPAHEVILGRAAATVPLARSIGAAVMAPLVGMRGTPARLTDEAKAEMQERGMALPEENSLGESYRVLKRAGEARRELGRKQSPKLDLLGTGLGIGASLAAPGLRALKATGVAARVVPAFATAATYGGLTSLENSPAELTKGEFGQAWKDAVGVTGLRRTREHLKQGHHGRAALELMGSGVIGGGLTGGVTGAAVEAVRRPLSNTLKAYGIRKGKDVLQGGSDIAAPTRRPLSDEAVQEVLDSKLMGGTTQETYAKIEKEAGTVGDLYGQIVRDLEAQGVRGPDVRKLADELFEKYAQRYRNTGADKAEAQALFDEAANIEDIAEGAPNMSLGRMEDVKRSVQNAARFDRLKNSAAEDGRQEAASMIRQANENAIAEAAQRAGPDSEISRLAADFVPTKQRLGRILEARTAAERGAVKAAARSSGPGIVDHLVGASTGDPATAYLTALAVNKMRSRLPSALSRYSYGAGNQISSGASQAGLAKLLALTGGAGNAEMSDEERKAELVRALLGKR